MKYMQDIYLCLVAVWDVSRV